MRCIPTLLSSLILAVAIAATPMVAQTIRPGSRGADLDRYMQWAARAGFAGAVLVSDREGIVLHQAYGQADRRAATPNTIHTVFDVGSIAKSFTSAALVLMQQRGELRLTDSIGKYLPGVPADKAAITIEQLLTHASGLPPDYSRSDTTVMTREEALNTVLGLEPEFAPGSGTEYSDGGYVLAAIIIELRSGMPFVDFLRTQLFEPAGMRSTGFYSDPRWKRTGAAHGYRGDRDLGSPVSWPGPWWSILGGGGLVTTAFDLYQWDRAMRGSGILNDASREEYFRGRIDDGGGSQYALGWTVTQGRDGEEIVKTGGGNLMHHAVYLRNPLRGELIVIVTAGMDMRPEVLSGLRTLFRNNVSIPAPPTAPVTAQLPDAAFTSPAAGTALVWRDDANRQRIALRGGELIRRFGAATATSAHRDSSAVALVRAVMTGQSAVIRGLIGDSARAATLETAVRRYIASQANRLGPWQGVVALGTVVPWWNSIPLEATIVELEFERGTSTARMEWLANGGIQLGGAAIPFPVNAYLLPAGGDAWMAANLAHAVFSPVTAPTTDGPIGELRIGGEVLRNDSSRVTWVPKRSLAVLLDNALGTGGIALARQRLAAAQSGQLPGYAAVESELNDVGYALLGSGETAGAVLVLGAAATAFPDSWNAHDSHGEALAVAGDTAAAIRAYERSLQLNPSSAGGRRALERLRAGRN